MKKNDENYNCQTIMDFYEGTNDLLIHYSTTRYWIWALFFILSILSAMQIFNSCSNNETKMLFTVSAFLFLFITAIGNVIFTKFVRNQAEIMGEIEDKLIFEKKDNKQIESHLELVKRQIESHLELAKRKTIVKECYWLFNFCIWLALGIYTILLSLIVWITFKNCLFLVLSIGIPALFFTAVVIWLECTKVKKPTDSQN